MNALKEAEAIKQARAEEEEFKKTGGKVSERLTVRDHFAGRAMQALLTSKGIPARYPYATQSEIENDINYITSIAYKYADAMLKRRAGK